MIYERDDGQEIKLVEVPVKDMPKATVFQVRIRTNMLVELLTRSLGKSIVP
jgi:hypothetical protein